MAKSARKLKRERRARKEVHKVFASLQTSNSKFSFSRMAEIGGHVVAEVNTEIGEMEARRVLATMPDCGEIVKLYHGTPSIANFRSITDFGFWLSRWGMLGEGVYLGHEDKAINYTMNKRGVMLICVVALGDVYESSMPVMRAPGNQHTIHMSSSSYNRREEWCVKDASRVIVIGAYLFRKPNGEEWVGSSPTKTLWVTSSMGRSSFSSGRSISDPVVKKLLEKPRPPGVRKNRTY